MTRGYVGGITLTDIETAMDENWSTHYRFGTRIRIYRDNVTGKHFEITSNSAGYVETLYYRGKFSTEKETPLNDIIRKILRRLV